MSKFERAVHYVVANTKPEDLGRTKLAKVLLFADLESFRRTGRSITGAQYEKRQHGPMPRDLYPAIERLAESGKIAERRVDYFGRQQHQFWSLQEPELDDFTAHDVATLVEVARIICENHTATSISDVTHNAAWELAGTGEEIPLAALLAAWRSGKPSQSELEAIEAELGA